MKTYQHGYYNILLCFDSMLSYNTSVQNDEFMKRRNQNQKFSFPFFAGSPHTPRRKRNCKEIFGFGSATEGSVRGASIIRQNPADFVRNTFELRPIHTANTIYYRSPPHHKPRSMILHINHDSVFNPTAQYYLSVLKNSKQYL